MISDYVSNLVQAAPHPVQGVLDRALTSTIHHILGVRDGSGYRYEADIETAREAFATNPRPTIGETK